MRLDDFLHGKKTIGIAGHIHPDGDCVGSNLGVYNYIRTVDPSIDVSVYLEPIPNIFKFLKGADQIQTADPHSERVFDLFIVLDCGDTGRLGDAAVYFEHAKETLCIDHHLSNSSFADHNHIVPDASSTCELVFDLTDPDNIDCAIAECLYTGIIHDTGLFQYDCTSRHTMEAAGVLMEKGIDFSKIVDQTFNAKTFEQNRIMGRALLDARRYQNNRVIASVVTAEEMKEYSVLPKHLDGIVSQLRETKDVFAALFLYEQGNGVYKVSARASCDINLVTIAARYGGGGHAKAVGFTIQGDPWEAAERLAGEIAVLLDE